MGDEREESTNLLSSVDEEAIAEIECLARSPNRLRLLAAIADEAPVEKGTLRRRFEMSRTTLSRNLDLLEQRGWIEESAARAYAVTPAGAVVVEHLADLLDVTNLSNQLRPVFEWLPNGALDLDLSHLADADVMIAEPGDPWAMINHHVATLKTMDECRALLPFVGLHATEAGADRVIYDAAIAEVVVTPSVSETFQSNPQYTGPLVEAASTGRFEVSVYEGGIPYGLNIIDETVQIVVADDEQPRALLETEGEAVQEWADRKFQEYKEEAERLILEPRVDDHSALTLD